MFESGRGVLFLGRYHRFCVSHLARMRLVTLKFGDICKRCIIVLEYHCITASRF